MGAAILPSDAELDPWCLVELVTGERLLFGFATRHPIIGGLAWVRSTPVAEFDEAARHAHTASGRGYRLGRRIEVANLPAEGEEAWLAYDLLVRSHAADQDTVPRLSTDPAAETCWLAACKIARHLDVAKPVRSSAAVEAFIRQNADAYLRRHGSASHSNQASSDPARSDPTQSGMSDAVDQSVGDAWPEADDPDGQTVERPDLDPACMAAHCLLRRALDAVGISIEDIGCDGVVVLVVLPDAPWTEIVRDQWKAEARNGERWQTGAYSWRRERSGWAVWAPDEPTRPSYRDDIAEECAKAISRGYHCVGLAADVAWLPADLVQSADYRLTLPALSPDDVAHIATLLCSHAPTERLSDTQAAAVTPRLLRLARRPRQTADAYLAKLRGLLDMAMPVAAVTPTTVSPRNAPSLHQMFGMDEAVAFGNALACDIKAVSEGRITWAAVDRGCVLSGPPGVGKTLFAQALATSCGVPLLTGSYAAWLGTGAGHQGDLMLAMRKTFRLAREQAPCILFLDELDSFPDRSKVSHSYKDWSVQVVNGLLAEIDGVESRDGVIIVGACNDASRVDPALLRSGRLDRHIRIDLPDFSALARILREHLGADLAGEDLSVAGMAATGSSGADCERLVRGARRRARSAGRGMQLADLLDEIGGVDERSADDLWVAAIHEAGHAVAACMLWPGSLGMVSLEGTAKAGGLTTANGPTSAFFRADDLQGRLIMSLAGRAAEAMIFGRPSAGAGGAEGSDLAQATHLAVTAIVSWGLDEPTGLVWRGRPGINDVPVILTKNPGLAERVRCMLDEAYAAACSLIAARTAAVTALASILVVRRVLTGADAEDIVRQNSGEARNQP